MSFADTKGESAIHEGYKQGEAVFEKHCAVCHENSATGAPAKSVLMFSMSPVTIYDALTSGRMRTQGSLLADRERRQVAEYLTGRRLNTARSREPKRCAGPADWFDGHQTSLSVGWGIDPENTRLISEQQAQLTLRELTKLKLKWAFAYPNLTRAVSQPIVAGGGLFVGSQDGTVYALDARSGCVHWTFKAEAEIAGAPVVHFQRDQAAATLFVGDRFAYTYAIDAGSGRLLWKRKMDDHPAAEIVGTPVWAQELLYVPVASIEEWSIRPEYACCSFRGSIVALNAATGDTVWKRYTIPATPAEQCVNAAGKMQLGPSGAGVWATLTIDQRRSRLYFATGNNYSAPSDENSDAIFAIDLSDGEIIWRTQTRTGDFWNNWDSACQSFLSLTQVPQSGPDVDFSAPPILVKGANGDDILIAGRKDGVVFGIAPDSGAIQWSTRITDSPDPYAAELLFGMMADGTKILFPSQGSKVPGPEVPLSLPDDGLNAIDAFTGKLLWRARVSTNCGKHNGCLGIAFAPIGITGAAFAGAQDGYVRAYDTNTGHVIWRFDTARHFKTLNGDTAKGGAIVRSGAMIADGMLYVNSGYGMSPGNVLLAFTKNDIGQGSER
jgi:polyvinyl alcohol dehydrogenase (cytochrome)